MRYTYLLLAFLFISLTAKAQSSNYTFESLHRQRLKTNVTGMSILVTWGAANLAAGGAGYFIANDEEWRAFHGMNAIWGATNLGIGILGTIGSKKDLRKTVSCDKMLSGYESTKRLFLVNAGLDVAYIGTGLMLHAKANNFNKPAEWRGFGKSIAMQGIGLLIFDGTMFSLHQNQNKKWYKVLQGVCVTGDGIGFRYGL